MMPHSGEAHRSQSKVASYGPIASEEAQNQETSGSFADIPTPAKRCVVPSFQSRYRAISCSSRCVQLSLRPLDIEETRQAAELLNRRDAKSPAVCCCRDVLHAPSGPLSHLGTLIRPHELV